MAKIFSRFDSVAPTQRSRKFLKTTQGMPSSPAQHCTRNVLPVPMRPANQVAHRQRAQGAPLQQLGVLAQPGLDRVEPGDVVERERRLDEVEQALALALDQVLLDLAQPVGGDAAVVAERQGDRRPRADAAQAGEPRRDRVERHVRA